MHFRPLIKKIINLTLCLMSLRMILQNSKAKILVINLIKVGSSLMKTLEMMKLKGLQEEMRR